MTVRSEDKGNQILKAHPDAKDKLSFVIVKDVAQEGAFDEVSGASAQERYIINETTGCQIKPSF